MKLDITHQCVECEEDIDVTVFYTVGSSHNCRNEDAMQEEASCEPRCCPFCDKEIDAHKLAFWS